MPLKFAVVGAGRMGKLHARVLSEMTDVQLVAVVDSHAAAAESLAAQRRCRAESTLADVVGQVDAAIISVPTVHHVDVARPFIIAGKPVLIEKPLCDDLESAKTLIALARQHGALVQVGHAERFNPAVMAMRKYAIEPKFIESHRISPYTFRSTDVGVVLDMMIHDLDIVLMLAGRSEVASVDAVGVNIIGASEDIANARVVFANGCVANITASRVAIKTERKIRVFSEQAYLSVDYQARKGIVVQKSDNLDLIQMARKAGVQDLADLAQKVDYKSLVHVEQLQVDDSVEPLRRQAEAFVRAIRENVPPEVSAEDGLAALALAKRITEAVKSHQWDGRPDGRVGPDLLAKTAKS
jgi:predicted dehydrogenase